MLRALAAILLALLALSPAAAAAPETLTLGIVAVAPLSWPVFVARDKGFYERQGVTLDLVVTGTSATATQALTGGSLHMTASSTAEERYAEQAYRVFVEEPQMFPQDLRLSPPGLRKVLDNMITLGVLKPPAPDLAAYVDFGGRQGRAPIGEVTPCGS